MVCAVSIFQKVLGSREFRVELSCDVSIKFGSLLLATIIMRTIKESNLLTYSPTLSVHVIVSNFRLSNGLVDSPLLLHKPIAVSKTFGDVAKHSRPILHCTYRTYQIWDLCF